MSGEKKHWRLSTPLRRFSGTQDPQLKAEVGNPGRRISSVYLSDNCSTSRFIIAPEFDYPVQTRTTHEKSNHDPPLPASPSSPQAVYGYPTNLEPVGSRCSYLHSGPYGREDDLTQRLCFAYDHIRSMPSATSPKVLMSSNPQMVRKQLGVPQHSVFNHPIPSSPDLPNPHASPPTPPGSPFAITPPDVISMHMHTNVYPACQSTQSKSAETTPPPTEKFPSQCSPLGTPWSAHAACTSRPQPSNPSSSKPAKRRVEKATSSPSSLPSTARQALRGVLRKSGTDTSPSANPHRRQISLPQLRPPSPFRVNIPLHHAWHDRRTDLDSSTELNSKILQFHETNSRRTSGGTEVLASLAWIGTPYTANRICHPTSPEFFPDHLSMGIAVEDDSLSDDVLVERLEKVRRMSGPSGPPTDGSPSRSSSNAGGEEISFSPMFSSQSVTDQLTKPHGVPPISPLTSKDATSDSEDAAVWQAARKALLCIREIVRTEKRYQEALKMLLNAQTATPPPPSMTPYVSALVRASEMLLKRFLEDPSAWGVSTAFVTSEDELEATMVSWCAVAGTFFTDRNDSGTSNSTGRWRLRKSGVMPPLETKRTSMSPGPQLPPMFSMVTSSDIRERTVDGLCEDRHLQTEAEKQTLSVPLEKPQNTNKQFSTPSRKLSVRDLAIQPIQRVMRYVLLYKDLLDCTPATSPPRLLVQRALEAASRIANHCDRAQRNPAFCHSS